MDRGHSEVRAGLNTVRTPRVQTDESRTAGTELARLACGRRNAPVRTAMLEHMQRTSGNRAVQRHLAVQRDTGSGSGAPTPAPAPAPNRPPPVPATPTETFVIPFDHTPLSSPGEQIMFHGLFENGDPALFQFVFTGAGGKFDTAAGPATKTVQGLDSGNVSFFIDRAWNGTSAVTVRLELKRLSDGVAVKTYNWTFGKKTLIPTTMTQLETEGERPLGSAYSYKIGPDIGNDGRIDYGHETILETFGAPTSNLTMADLKPAWKAAHPGVTTDAQLTAHFFPGSGANGTFTVDADDKIKDQHDGMPDKAQFEAALTTMKEIHMDLPQTYTVKAGTALGRYNIRRILKPDGSKLLKKTKI